MRLEGNSVIETNYYQDSPAFAASPNRLSGIEKTYKSAKKLDILQYLRNFTVNKLSCI